MLNGGIFIEYFLEMILKYHHFWLNFVLNNGVKSNLKK
jgi:hypothetical protein